MHILWYMQWRWPEKIPMRKGISRNRDFGNTNESWEKEWKNISGSRKIKKKVQRKVQITCNIRHIIHCNSAHWFSFFSWIEEPMNMETAVIFTNTMEKILKKELIFFLQESSSGKVNIIIQLEENRASSHIESYNIRTVQCEFSRTWIIWLQSFLWKAEELRISKYCPNFLLLCKYFDTINLNSGLMVWLDESMYN